MEKKLKSNLKELKLVNVTNSTHLLEREKKIEEGKKKINDRDKNILDHLTVLQKFRMI